MNWTRRPSSKHVGQVFTVRVLARPGPPSSSRWPPAGKTEEEAFDHRLLVHDDLAHLGRKIAPRRPDCCLNHSIDDANINLIFPVSGVGNNQSQRPGNLNFF